MQKPQSRSSRAQISLSRGFNQRKCPKCKQKHNECHCLKDELIHNRRGQANMFKAQLVDQEEDGFFTWVWYDVFHITSPCPDDPNPYVEEW